MTLITGVEVEDSEEETVVAVAAEMVVAEEPVVISSLSRCEGNESESVNGI